MEMNLRPRLLLPFAAILLATTVAWASDDDDEITIPFDEAELFFELNNSDGDLGIHTAIDGGPWKKLGIENTRERTMMVIDVRSNLRKQGLTQLFIESAEPVFDDLPPDVFFARFPEGEYEIEGWTLEGDELESVTELTHLMPAPPQASINMEPIALVCDDENPDYDAPEVATPIVISWPAVELSHDTLGSPLSSRDIVIHNYEVVVEVGYETADGEELTVVSSTILPPEITSYTVPDELIALSTPGNTKCLRAKKAITRRQLKAALRLPNNSPARWQST